MRYRQRTLELDAKEIEREYRLLLQRAEAIHRKFRFINPSLNSSSISGVLVGDVPG
jgi:hypothetical protein